MNLSMLIFLSLVLELSSSLTHQLAQIYGEHREHEDDGTFDDGTFIIYYVRMITCNNFFICYTVILACHVPHVQQQVGTYDCGIFAIAFALHAALGQKISSIEFNQSAMRTHLMKCFSKKKLMPFPFIEKLSARRHYFPMRHISLYCVCFMPETFGDMVECEVCETWFHQRCVGYSCEQNWRCSSCAERPG